MLSKALASIIYISSKNREKKETKTTSSSSRKRMREKELMRERSGGLLWISYDGMVWVPLRYAMSVVKEGLAGRKEGSN